MFRACSRCGKIHPYTAKCSAGIEWNKYKTDADKLHNTTAWHNKAAEIKERSMFLCAVCVEDWKMDPINNRLASEELEVHHIIKLRENPDLLLEDSNLICLCRKHHKAADRGLLDPDYLTLLAKQRDAEI